jgi:hypothetical protein
MMQYHIKPQSLGRSKPTQRIAVLGVLLMGLMGISLPAVAADEPWATLVGICANDTWISGEGSGQPKKTDGKLKRNICLQKVFGLAKIDPAIKTSDTCNPFTTVGGFKITDCNDELLKSLNLSEVRLNRTAFEDGVCSFVTVEDRVDDCKAEIKKLPDSLFLASSPSAASAPVSETQSSINEKLKSSATDKDNASTAESIDQKTQTYIDAAVKKSREDETNGLSWLSLIISLLALGAVFYSRHTQTHTNTLQSTGQAAPISQIPQKPITQPNQNLGLTLGQQQQISRLIEEQLKLQQQGLLAKLKQEIDSKLEEAIPIIPIQPITIVDTFKAIQPDVILTPQQPSPVKQPPEKLVTADLQQLLSLYQTWAKDSRGMISLKDWLPPPINEKLERLGYQICCWKAGREVDLMIVDTSPPTATKAVGIIRIQDKQGYAYCLTKTHSVAQIWQAQTWYKVTQQGEQLQQIAEISV